LTLLSALAFVGAARDKSAPNRAGGGAIRLVT
jgi:hypothetical protein